MAEYTVEMFREDFANVMPIFLSLRSLESLDGKSQEQSSENNVQDVINYFIKKYGNNKGTDYQIRFLSIMQFIEHYHKDLVKAGLVTDDNTATQVPDTLLQLLLESIKSPQSPSPYPSSSLFNQNHEFNYKKVIKAAKPTG